MKKIYMLLTLAVMAIAPVMNADAAVKAGPRKGLIMEIPGKNVEFLVDENRKVNIAFYDAAMKQVAPGDEVVTAIAEAPSGKTKLEFERKGDNLVSKTSIPEGEGYQIVVQIKPSAEAKAKNFRVKLLMHICGECHNPEYACTCEH